MTTTHILSVFSLRFSLSIAFIAASIVANATWSIIGVDTNTQEVGIAGASCYPGSAIIAGVVPGHGVVTAQGLTSEQGKNLAIKMLQKNTPAQEIIDAITSSSTDKNWFFKRWSRQYAVASLHHSDTQIASYTGAFTLPNRGSKIGQHVSVQGNILRRKVIQNSFNAFNQTMATSTELAQALLAALVAGSDAGGDKRCSVQQTALSAFLIVAKPGDPLDKPALYLVAKDQPKGGANPVDLLAAMFYQYQTLQTTNPVTK